MSRKRRKARNLNIEAPIANNLTGAQIIPLEKPKATAVKFAVARIPMELLGSESLFKEFAIHLVEACELSRGRYTPQWAWGLALRDETQVWAVLADSKPAGCFVTTTQLYPATGLHVLQILLLGGNGLVRAASQIRDALITFKDERQCHRIEWYGRPGLQRLWHGSERIGAICEVA